MESDLVIYTDGACLGNPGPGGWAWAVASEGAPCASGCDAQTTNQRMEVTAVLEAVRETDRRTGSLRIVSDSTYVVNCFVDRWWEGWRRRGWKNTQGKPVANRDLWEPLLACVLTSGRSIEFRWVKGHSGDRWNDVVDALATGAAARQSGIVPVWSSWSPAP